MSERQRQGVTKAAIAQKFGVPLRQVDHDCRKVRKQGGALLRRALAALEARFSQEPGLVAEGRRDACLSREPYKTLA